MLGVVCAQMLALAPGIAADSHSSGLLAGAALGALLPDLDASQSMIKSLRIGRHFQPFLLPAALLHHAFGHRGFLHSLLGLGCVGAFAALPLGLWLGGQFAAALLLGYASHLAGDGCTKSGVPLWFPRRGRWHLLPSSMRLTTGSQEEDAIFALAAGAALLLLALQLPRP